MEPLERVNNIIRIDFTKNLHKVPAVKTDSLCWHTQSYLEICASTLDEEDYWDLLEAIHNVSFFETIDPDLQDLVLGYFDSLQVGHK